MSDGVTFCLMSTKRPLSPLLSPCSLTRRERLLARVSSFLLVTVSPEPDPDVLPLPKEIDEEPCPPLFVGPTPARIGSPLGMLTANFLRASETSAADWYRYLASF